MTGIIANIQRFSMHDGPGVRSTIFFKGCPLNCLWCHNPETIAFGEELRYKAADCMHCMHCVTGCAAGALSVNGGGIAYDKSKCARCFTCVYHCPTTALAKVGSKMSVSAVMREIEPDAGMYEKTGGGVTLSGGEPTAQHEFAGALLDCLRKDGIHSALDTCGLCETERFLSLSAKVDLILFDLKHADPDKHKQLTGAANTLILKNFAALSALNVPIEVRIPIIPGLNDDDSCLRLGAIIADNPRVARVMLLGYHPLGRTKIHSFNQLGADLDITPLTRDRMRELTETMSRATGLNVGFR